jgi:hypothetical protein
MLSINSSFHEEERHMSGIVNVTRQFYRDRKKALNENFFTGTGRGDSIDNAGPGQAMPQWQADGQKHGWLKGLSGGHDQIVGEPLMWHGNPIEGTRVLGPNQYVDKRGSDGPLLKTYHHYTGEEEMTTIPWDVVHHLAVRE